MTSFGGLVKWESTDETKPQNVELLAEARWEIARSLARSSNETPPDRDDRNTVLSYLNDKGLPIYDPFCGGGSIPLEAQRLGLRATVGSDLNPVAVLITKALIDFPHQFQGQPPVNPSADPMGITTGKGEKGQTISMAWSGWTRQRHPLLRPMDAGKGLGAHRPLLPHGQTTRW